MKKRLPAITLFGLFACTAFAACRGPRDDVHEAAEEVHDEAHDAVEEVVDEVDDMDR